MYSVSNQFVQNSRLRGRRLNARLSWDNVILEGDAIYRLEKLFEGDFYRSIMQQIKGEVKGRYDLTDKVIKVEIGISFDGSPFEYVDYGFFIVKEHERIVGSAPQYDKTSFTAYDAMLNAHTLYDVNELGVEFPISINNLFVAIANHIGLQASDHSIVNGDKIISEDKWTNIENVTYRNILDEISATSGGSILIHDNKLSVKYVDTSIDVQTVPDVMKIYEDNMKSLKLSKQYGDVNMLNLTREQAHDNYVLPIDWEDIPVNERCEIVIADNQIMDKNREVYAPDLFNSVIGLGYYPFESDAVGTLHFEPMDVVNVVDMNGDSHLSVVTTSVIVVTSGLKEEIKSTIPGKAKEQYALVTDNRRQFLRVYFLVDQQNGVIQGLIEKTDEQQERLTDLKLTVDGLDALVRTIGNDSIALNLNGEFENYDYWTFFASNNPMLSHNGLVSRNGLTNYNTFEVLEDQTSLSNKLSFFGNGSAKNGRWRVVDTKYSFRCKLVSGAQPFTLNVLEYENDTLSQTQSQTFYAALYPQHSFELLETTTHIELEFITTGVSLDNRLELSEMMFNRGLPREYVESSESFKLWAESNFQVQAEAIQFTQESIKNVDQKISNTTVKITGENGLQVWNNNGKGISVMDNNDTEVISLTSEGKLKTVDMIAENMYATDAFVEGELIVGDMRLATYNEGGVFYVQFKHKDNASPDNSLTQRGVTITQSPPAGSDAYMTQIQNVSYLGASTRTGNLEINAALGEIAINSPLITMNDVLKVQSDRIYTLGTLFPNSSNTYDLGQSAYRWRNIYLNNNPVVGSDERYKYDIQDVDPLFFEYLSELKPKMYRSVFDECWHFGYVAQDVEQILYKYCLKRYGHKTANSYISDFKVLVSDESYLSLVYAELSALIDAYTRGKLKELEERIEALEGK